MLWRRRVLIHAATLASLMFAVPAGSIATVDPSCNASAASGVSGTVTNVGGARLQGVVVELRQPNKGDASIVAQAQTLADGTYRICAAPDTYDVRAHSSNGGLWAAQNKPANTLSDFAAVDFVMEYKLNLTISPQAVRSPVTQNVAWTIRSKAPCAPGCTTMRMTLDHLGGPIMVAPAGTEAGGPSAGGWNLWRIEQPIGNKPESVYWATVEGLGLDQAGHPARITELARDPYVVDAQAPLFGPQAAGSVDCVGGHRAGPFSPSQTTNPRAIVTVGVCDPASGGGRSGLDPFTVEVDVCDGFGASCVPATGILSTWTIVYLPPNPMPVGTYKLRYRIRDYAGNATESGFYTLQVTSAGGSIPTISGVQPGSLGEGQNLGVVIGGGQTTPTSRAVVAFQARDPDGQFDLVPGSLRVRIYSPDQKVLLYDYDPRLSCGLSPPPSNCGTFDLSGGRFEATGFSLVGAPPGLYIATASIADHGGNATTRAWRWIQVLTA
jgi:hypothetical protein